MSRIRLTATDRRRLEMQLAQVGDARRYRRTLAILKVAEGWPIPQVAEFLEVNRSSVHRWLESYLAEREPEDLADRPLPGRPRIWEPEQLALLESLLQENPQDCGYAASQWTVPLLSEHLRRCGLPACSRTTLRRRLHELDRVWKRPRYALEEDPEAEKKTAHPHQAHASSAP